MVKLISTDSTKHGISGDVLELLGVLCCVGRSLQRDVLRLG
jgi:hypothetical protein